MTGQIHKRLSGEQVRIILDRYIQKEISVLQAMNLLDLKRRQFFEWVKRLDCCKMGKIFEKLSPKTFNMLPFSISKFTSK
ncbi:MAG: hypothetical protein HZB80_08200 [Deltaproteobacteria bacterium]|nr:hypothetical protein [Deltaproteobacteria bacterium]